MAAAQAYKAAVFQTLHKRPGAFVLSNPWDAGTARLLAAQGHVALATTSAGLASMLGRRDGACSQAETLASARLIVDATDLPVAADLKNGFGDLLIEPSGTPNTGDEAAAAVRQAI